MSKGNDYDSYNGKVITTRGNAYGSSGSHSKSSRHFDHNMPNIYGNSSMLLSQSMIPQSLSQSMPITTTTTSTPTPIVPFNPIFPTTIPAVGSKPNKVKSSSSSDDNEWEYNKSVPYYFTAIAKSDVEARQCIDINEKCTPGTIVPLYVTSSSPEDKWDIDKSNGILVRTTGTYKITINAFIKLTPSTVEHQCDTFVGVVATKGYALPGDIISGTLGNSFVNRYINYANINSTTITELTDGDRLRFWISMTCPGTDHSSRVTLDSSSIYNNSKVIQNDIKSSYTIVIEKL